MPDYSKGKIYKITSPSHPGECYIGSTTRTLNDRLSRHKTSYTLNLNKSSQLIMCYGDAIIQLIEDFPCSSAVELERREGYHMREHMNNDEKEKIVNCYIAGRTDKEWREDNKEKIALQKKIRYEANKEKIAIYGKDRYQKNKTEINRKSRIYALTKVDEIRAYQKTYRINKKEEVARNQKEYRIKNKEILSQKSKVKINCEFCGQLGNKPNMVRHQRSKKCQAIQEQKSKNGFSASQSASVPPSLTGISVKDAILAL
tara:strand:- start:796 stop:1569 length:774 start_codon:yes stop_codon:yes gene_type:complete